MLLRELYVCFSVTGLADKLPKMTPLSLPAPVYWNRNQFLWIHFKPERVNTLYHGGSQGSCDFVSMASPHGTMHFKSCLVQEYVWLLNRGSFTWEAKASLSSFLPKVFLRVDKLPQGHCKGRVNQSTWRKSRLINTKWAELAFSVWAVPGNPA